MYIPLFGSLSDRLAAWVCEGTFMCYSVSIIDHQWPPWIRANRWTLFSWTLQRHLAECHIISCCKKLGNFDISGALLNWCKDYLTDREQRVVIEGIHSTWWAIPSGVPQGSLLGPLFFEIFISDLPEVVIPGNCVSLYADDCKTSRIINRPADHSVFQSDLDSLYAWSQ